VKFSKLSLNALYPVRFRPPGFYNRHLPSRETWSRSCCLLEVEFCLEAEVLDARTRILGVGNSTVLDASMCELVYNTLCDLLDPVLFDGLVTDYTGSDLGNVLRAQRINAQDALYVARQHLRTPRLNLVYQAQSRDETTEDSLVTLSVT
jgi:hypothetical protein